MLDEDPPDLRVCRNLGKTKLVKPNSQDGSKFNIADIFSEDIREDSDAEAYRFAIRNIFQDEAILPLMKEVLDISNTQLTQNEKDGFLDKINIYCKRLMMTFC